MEQKIKTLYNQSQSSLKIEEKWLTHSEAANYLGLTPKALYNLSSNGKVKVYKLAGRRNRYALEDLNKLFFQQNKGRKYGN